MFFNAVRNKNKYLTSTLNFNRIISSDSLRKSTRIVLAVGTFGAILVGRGVELEVALFNSIRDVDAVSQKRITFYPISGTV